MKFNRCFLALVLSIFICVTYAQVIPAERRTDWSLAGYRGSIPAYNNIINMLDFGALGDGNTVNDLALQNAIASLAGQNGVLFFPAGTYIFNASIVLRSGLVLRGEGATATILQFNLTGLGNLITAEGSLTTDIAVLTAAASKNDTSLLVDNPTLFQVNDYIKIYQNDKALVMDPAALESVGQLVQIDRITGNEIFFTSPLRKNYSLQEMPRIRRFNMITGVGIECLKIKRIDAASPLRSNIFFRTAAQCWVKGIESDSSNFAHVRIYNSTNIEITNSYFHGAFSYGGGGEGYGIACEYTTGECLIENNIFKHLRHAMLLQYGANGNVLDYNYSIEAYKSESAPNDLSGDIVMHGNYPYLNLIEGNIAQNILIDAAHGKNGPFNTLFRNRAELYGLIISSGGGDSSNIIGNEITGNGFGKGNYIVRGTDNLEYGNNNHGSIVPTGTSTLADGSYIYEKMPSFWNIASPWPPIGPANTLNTGTNPARERYLAGTGLSFCLAVSPVVYTFNGNGNWSQAGNWADNKMPPAILTAGSEILIDPPVSGQCILDIPYTLTAGFKLTVAGGKSFVVQGNLTIAK